MLRRPPGRGRSLPDTLTQPRTANPPPETNDLALFESACLLPLLLAKEAIRRVAPYFCLPRLTSEPIPSAPICDGRRRLLANRRRWRGGNRRPHPRFYPACASAARRLGWRGRRPARAA